MLFWHTTVRFSSRVQNVEPLGVLHFGSQRRCEFNDHALRIERRGILTSFLRCKYQVFLAKKSFFPPKKPIFRPKKPYSCTLVFLCSPLLAARSGTVAGQHPRSRINWKLSLQTVAPRIGSAVSARRQQRSRRYPFTKGRNHFFGAGLIPAP